VKMKGEKNSFKFSPCLGRPRMSGTAQSQSSAGALVFGFCHINSPSTVFVVDTSIPLSKRVNWSYPERF
jgi:hypothetical protein